MFQGVLVEIQGLDGAAGKVDGLVVIVFFVIGRLLENLVEAVVIFVLTNKVVSCKLDRFFVFEGV